MDTTIEKGWIGVDLDGTLALYERWQGPVHIGDPIMPMLLRVQKWLSDGVKVRIVTARVSHDGTPERMADAEQAETAIREWCATHVGRCLPVTNCKDYDMIELWDDRCVQLVRNTGLRADGLP